MVQVRKGRLVPDLQQMLPDFQFLILYSLRSTIDEPVKCYQRQD